MLELKKRIHQINLFFLPLAAFFLLISSAATNLFIILNVLLSTIICIFRQDLIRLFEKRIFIVCIVLYSILLISSFYSIAENEQILEVVKKYIKLLYIPFVYYSITIYNNSEKIIKFFIVGCTIVLIMSYLKFFSILNFEFFYNLLEEAHIANVKEKIITNKATIFQHYIIQGTVLSLYSFLCLFYAVKRKYYLYYFLSILSFINVLFMNDSRSAFIIIFILLVFSLFFIINNSKVRIAIFTIIVLMSISQISENLENRLQVISTDIKHMENNNYDTSLGLRTLWIKVGVDNFLNKPLFGYGSGSFKITSKRYYIDNDISSYKKYITNNPHNEFISFSSQLGLIGLSLFILFLFYLFKESKGNILNLGIFSIVFISSIFNSAFYDNMLGLFLVIIVGILLGNKSKIQKKIK